MNNQQSNESEFFIYLTIEGTNIEKAEVLITDLNKSIKEQIEAIVKTFYLPEIHTDGVPPYMLFKDKDGTSDFEFLGTEDENGRKQCLRDYNIKPGDHLVLIRIPVVG